MWPDLVDGLPRVEGEPDDWHVRRTNEDGHPIMGSSPAERAERAGRGAPEDPEGSGRPVHGVRGPGV